MLSWMSSDPEVLEVVELGQLTVLDSVGVAWLIVESEENQLRDRCRVRIDPSGQTNYELIPISIPGRVEAENYDIGGQNVSYYDPSVEDKTCNGRDDEVDLEDCDDEG